MTSQSKLSQRTRYIPIRFSVRQLIVVISLCAIWIGYEVRQHRTIAQSIAILNRQRSTYDCKPFKYWSVQSLLPEIKSTYGQPLLGRITDVRNHGKLETVSDSEQFYFAVKQLPNLEILVIDGGAVNDALATRILKLPLDSLALSEMPIGGSPLVQPSPTLAWLSFHRTRLDDNSLRSLGQMPNLKYLDLTRTRISDASIDYLATLQSLTTLIVCRTKISEGGFYELRRRMPATKLSYEKLRH